MCLLDSVKFRCRVISSSIIPFIIEKLNFFGYLELNLKAGAYIKCSYTQLNI